MIAPLGIPADALALGERPGVGLRRLECPHPVLEAGDVCAPAAGCTHLRKLFGDLGADLLEVAHDVALLEELSAQPPCGLHVHAGQLAGPALGQDRPERLQVRRRRDAVRPDLRHVAPWAQVPEGHLRLAGRRLERKARVGRPWQQVGAAEELRHRRILRAQDPVIPVGLRREQRGVADRARDGRVPARGLLLAGHRRRGVRQQRCGHPRLRLELGDAHGDDVHGLAGRCRRRRGGLRRERSAGRRGLAVALLQCPRPLGLELTAAVLADHLRRQKPFDLGQPRLALRRPVEHRACLGLQRMHELVAEQRPAGVRFRRVTALAEVDVRAQRRRARAHAAGKGMGGDVVVDADAREVGTERLLEWSPDLPLERAALASGHRGGIRAGGSAGHAGRSAGPARERGGLALSRAAGGRDRVPGQQPRDRCRTCRRVGVRMYPQAAKVVAWHGLHPGSVNGVQHLSGRTRYLFDGRFVGSITRDRRNSGRPERSLRMCAACWLAGFVAPLKHTR